MKNLILLFFMFFGFFACSSGQTDLVPQEFVAKYKITKDAQMLDVRTPNEWKQGKVDDATCMNFYDTDFGKQVEKLDKTKPVFVYCAAGGRSAKASKMLKDMGFKEVYNLKGGYADLVPFKF